MGFGISQITIDVTGLAGAAECVTFKFKVGWVTLDYWCKLVAATVAEVDVPTNDNGRTTATAGQGYAVAS